MDIYISMKYESVHMDEWWNTNADRVLKQHYQMFMTSVIW